MAARDQGDHQPVQIDAARGHAAEKRSGQGDAESSAKTAPPPPYEVQLDQEGVGTRAKVAYDGRVNIHIDQKSQRLPGLLGSAIRHHTTDALPQHKPAISASEHSSLPSYLTATAEGAPPPPMNVVVQVLGTRGDVQPFIALGLVLKTQYGHRVRLATHPTFRQLVEENGLEFFSISGDPAELMAFMVKNPGLMPGFETLRSGDVGRRRKGIYEILNGCWRSCIETGDGIGPAPRDDYLDETASFDSAISMSGDANTRPFIADVIIANPPSFAHVHIAEKLGIPLHLIFTMPWSPTQAFPHPLANVQSSNADTSLTNYISYALVEMLTWQGLGDVINKFREKALRLDPVSVMWAPGMLSRLRIPYTYCWSPALIPKPRDWGSHIDVSGFFFLALASSYVPAPDLVAFLAAGPPPVYIGFGSIVVEDPNGMTKLICEAVRKAGIRALVSKGWGGLGADELNVPEEIFMLGNVPHDWLFQHVSAVVHHGGAGTTAAGVALGRPTVVVPFFGDQPFWGAMIARAGAGPQPIPIKHLTADNLAAAIAEALQPSVLLKAAELGTKISSELGAEVGAKSFHRELGVDQLRCSLLPGRVAVWRVKRTKVRLSAVAATMLAQEGLLDFHDVKLYRPREYESDNGPWEPISGGASALIGSISNVAMGVADFPVEVIRALTTKPPENANPDCIRRSTSSASPSRTPSGTFTPRSPRVSGEMKRSPVATPTEGEPADAPGAETDVVRQRSTPSLSNLSSDGGGDENGHALPHAHHKKSMAQALSGRLSLHGRQRSRSHSRSGSTERGRPASPSSAGVPLHRSSTDCPAGQTVQAAVEATQGVGRIVGAGLKSPMDFTLALAKGFHNAPKLYGDKTVRTTDKVTGLQSGLKAAGKEFGYGFYDGISGLVTHPLQGGKHDGVAGFVKGVGRGVGGLILKPGAAIFGLPGYTFKGIYKEIQRQFGPSIESYIIAARTAQGYEDLKTVTDRERGDTIQGWNGMQDDIRKAKQTFAEETRQTVTEFKMKRQRTLDEYKKQQREKKDAREALLQQQQEEKAAAAAATHSGGGHDDDEPPSAPGHQPHQRSHSRSRFLPRLLHSRSFPGAPPKDARHPADLEDAIQNSVAVTSKGDAEQDELIERAIRASVNELIAAQHEEVAEHEALHRAIDASVSETKRMTPAPSDHDHDGDGDDDEEAALKDALHRSLKEYHVSHLDGRDLSSSELSHLSHLPPLHPPPPPPAAAATVHDHPADASHADHADHADHEPSYLRALEESRALQAQQDEEQARLQAEDEQMLERVKQRSMIIVRDDESLRPTTSTGSAHYPLNRNQTLDHPPPSPPTLPALELGSTVPTTTTKQQQQHTTASTTTTTPMPPPSEKTEPDDELCRAVEAQLRRDE
ncbi:MAG: hypothetical protein M1826_005177 [Phylliscum demangeonii]|nr:MAG: hypothetical protein M1826_005177 [Phylliscum demangeonii]